jgi:ssDNA-binding Zn-finger/Zn-ribbon topoisomerase 1
MDEAHPVDNAQSIHLNAECLGKKGEIYLSSIYGSYNYKSDIDFPKDEIAEFTCPHCDEHVTSETECLSCGAFMVPFYLDMGGKVSICSRSGCKNHHVEFNDLSVALKRLYQEYGYAGKQQKRPEVAAPKEKPFDERAETLESGTFLQAYCPHCKKSLIKDEMLKLTIVSGKEEGELMLSPYLNVFTTKSTIFTPEDKVVSDLKCPHCETSLIAKENKCGKCSSPVAKIQVTARTKLIDFYLCTRKGCKWHGLDEKDLFDIRLEDSMEW